MNDMTNTPGTGLMLPATTDLQALFREPGQVDPLIAGIEAEVRAHVPDTSTAKGREAIKSLAYKVARSKTALDDAGKALNEEARAQINQVDAARRTIRERLDALKDEARKPLTDWEAAEASRQDRNKRILEQLTNHGLTGLEASADIVAKAAQIRGILLPDDFGEGLDAAEAARAATMEALRNMYLAAQKREAEAAELEKLRKEAAERAAADEAARIERERIEAERLAAERAEQARKDAEARAAREAEERAAREKAEAERIERVRKEAAAEAEARHQRELAEAARREEQAAQRERDRIAAEKRAEEEAQRKREENARIRNRVRREITAALAALPQPLTPETVAEALVAGGIPNTTVRF